MSPTGAEHGSTTNRLSGYATTFALENDLGEGFAAETGFLIARNPDTTLAPDWAFIVKSRLPDLIPGKFMPVVPDLVLETRSPNDTEQEVADKVQEWLQAGVRMVWELDPKRRILTVYRPGEAPRALGIDDTFSGEEILPGFALPIRRLFP